MTRVMKACIAYWTVTILLTLLFWGACLWGAWYLVVLAVRCANT